MKDEMQNLTDLIGALAEDIEAIKTKLDEKDASDKDEALKRLAVKLEPIVRFAGGKAIDNINDIFRSEETIAAYRKSLGNEVIASLQANMEANEKDMRKRGIPSLTKLLMNIRKMLAEHIEESRQNSENGQRTAEPTADKWASASSKVQGHIQTDKITVAQNPRWLVQEPLRMDWHRSHTCIRHAVRY